MKQNTSRNRKRYILILCCLFALLPSLRAANSFGYTEERPLVIVCDWDFRPFEFVNVEGQPAGYNIDVLDMILNRLNIPHKFVMQEWHVATTMFAKHEADLIHALYSFYKDAPYVATHKYINYYNLKVARRIGTEPLNHISDLGPADTLLGKKDDYAALALSGKRKLPFTLEFHSPKDGLTGIRQGRYKYYIWGEIPLNHKIQELALDSIILDQINIPAGELRIIGYNKDLINIIDDQYTRLEQAGELQKVYDHWFRPEREHDDASPVALIILAGLFLASIVVLLLLWLVRRRVSMTVRESSDLGKMMDQVLNMGDYFMVEWDFKSNMLRNKYGKMIPHGEMRLEEFLQHMPQDEAQEVQSLNMQLATGIINHFEMNLSFNQGTDEQPRWRNFYGNAIVERENGKPQYIVYTIKDITDEVNEEQRIKTIASKYKKMFDTNLVAMSFYDAKGNLIDLNGKMRELCDINEKTLQYFHNTPLFTFPNLKGDYLKGSREVMHVCGHIDEPQLGLDKYVEFRIHPVTDDDNKLVYYIVTNRDITAERNMYLEQREHDRRLHTVNEAINRYERQLSYLLVESQMYIWNYRIGDNVINMSRTTAKTEYSETIEDYVRTVDPQARKEAMVEIQNAMQQGKPYITILPFENTLFDDGHCWYSIIGMPIFDKDGKLTEYFGLSRNITSLMEVQEQLRIETARAQDSGRLKAAFLANMTHEIRTPLNAIVGFSELLPMIDSPEEKKELTRIIMNNCDMLLRLINDILEASDMESRPMYVETTEIDFAQAFDDICLTLEHRVQESEVQLIKNNPYTTFRTVLDKGRIQQVITNFVTNAVKYTKQGHILVGYHATPDNSTPQVTPRDPLPTFDSPGILIYCEDTGAGIPQEKQASVFDRFVKLDEFVQGTGLGLSICKSIAERCGGQIGVISEGIGHGSTFWIWIPCESSFT